MKNLEQLLNYAQSQSKIGYYCRGRLKFFMSYSRIKFELFDFLTTAKNSSNLFNKFQLHIGGVLTQDWNQSSTIILLPAWFLMGKEIGDKVRIENLNYNPEVLEIKND